MKDYYIQIAKEACAYVHRVCTHGSANRQNGVTPESIHTAEENLKYEKHDFDAQVTLIESANDLTEDEKKISIIHLLASIAQRARAGNCQEMAALAFLFLQEKNIQLLEIVNTATHTFVILGRDPLTFINDVTSWNEDVIVCDPWQRKTSLRKHHLLQHDESMVFSPFEVFGFESDDLVVGYRQPSSMPEEVLSHSVHQVLK